ncbi:primase-helicase family protein [Bradyrhizobium erythrophlei]|uniref:NrS-1 polymerase-like helicase domain-containing protein n=1 Tax=Bradyrhizobium erythrophlei TaxID=1437360 RepID=A0A1M5I8P0_9BRAD|nr:primase-helicase family protein [Bradyrhizobium erythrophlei]SHG24163.1 hypothetical protein SAMN05443248_0837 [Bradyrhizobium erythrophlei]
MSMFGSDHVETGIEEAAAHLANLTETTEPEPDCFATSVEAAQQSSLGSGQANQSRSSNPALDFLDDIFGPDKRHLIGIKKTNGKTEIKAQHFDAADRAGQQAFITENGNASFDLYFTPNPVKGTLHKKASKNDIVEARHLWVDLDPRKTEPLEAERAAMLELLTNKLPNGLPRPNRVIDSGRGFWGYWKLDKPAAVDGSKNNVNGPLTEAVESYGRGIEQAFGDHFADGCRNIDRIARLPGTVNSKTSMLASVLQDFTHDAAHAIESFPQHVEAPKDQGDQHGGHFEPSDEYDQIDPTDPLLAKLPARWLEMLSEGDYAAAYGGDRSRAEMAFATAAMRAGIDESTIARCLMDERRAFGSNTRTSDRLLIRVIEKAHQYADNPVLEQMNREFAAGFIGNKFRIAKFDLHPRYPLQRKVEFLSKDDFINGVVNPRVHVPKFDQDGKQDGTKPAPRGAYWFALPGRNEFDAVTFQPGAPPIIEVEREGRIHRTINTYSGFSVTPDFVKSEEKCAKFLEHIRENIAGGDEALFKYILDWMASGVQHPDDPGRSAISMRGNPGCGKGVFALGYGRLFGQHFLHATQREHVTGKFNAHQAETCLIFVDEALYAEIEKDTQILKTMVSETTKMLERKGIDPIQIDNYARQIFATNDEHPIQIEHNDRRYPSIYVRENDAFAHERDEVEKAKKRKAYFLPIVAELKNGGSEALLGLLLQRDIRDFNAEAIPETHERRQQKLNSASPGDKVIIEFAQDACLPGAMPKRPWIARAHGERWLPKHLQTPGLYDVMKARGGAKLARMSDTALSGILKAWRFKSKPLGNSRGWEAPQLLDLRRSINDKFPAVEFDGRKEWMAHDQQDSEDPGASTGGTQTAQSAADTGHPDEADLALDELVSPLKKEKHDLVEETVSPPVKPSSSRVHRKQANLVDPVTGLTSPAAVSAFVRGASRQGL